jgi:hypothetical protein
MTQYIKRFAQSCAKRPERRYLQRPQYDPRRRKQPRTRTSLQKGRHIIYGMGERRRAVS